MSPIRFRDDAARAPAGAAELLAYAQRPPAFTPTMKAWSAKTLRRRVRRDRYRVGAMYVATGLALAAACWLVVLRFGGESPGAEPTPVPRVELEGSPSMAGGASSVAGGSASVQQVASAQQAASVSPPKVNSAPARVPRRQAPKPRPSSEAHGKRSDDKRIDGKQGAVVVEPAPAVSASASASPAPAIPLPASPPSPNPVAAGPAPVTSSPSSSPSPPAPAQPAKPRRKHGVVIVNPHASPTPPRR